MRRSVFEDPEQFWGVLVPKGACREWPGANVRGYGQVKVFGRRLYTHRYAFELARGPVPAGLKVLHTCDNPPCCEPTHLFLGTSLDNYHDMRVKGRGTTKLDPERVLAIREAVAQGGSQRAVARTFGVSQPTVHHIAAGRTWAHVRPGTSSAGASVPILRT